jgi:hypothetical protein
VAGGGEGLGVEGRVGVREGMGVAGKGVGVASTETTISVAVACAGVDVGSGEFAQALRKKLKRIGQKRNSRFINLYSRNFLFVGQTFQSVGK